MNAAMARIYGRRVPDIEAAAIAGTAADCVREVQAVADAGAGLILFTTVFDQAEQAERLAAEVMPQIAAGSLAALPVRAAPGEERLDPFPDVGAAQQFLMLRVAELPQR